MEALNIRKQFANFPMPTIVVGTEDMGQINWMTVAWCMQLEYNPPMIGIVLSKNHHTSKAIRNAGWFSVNLPTIRQMESTDYVGMVSGKETDKSKVFPVFYGDKKKVPMIEGCGIAFECALSETIEINGDPLFIGRVEGMYSDPEFLTDGKPDFAKIHPFIFCMADGSYWSLEKRVAKAWKVGESLRT